MPEIAYTITAELTVDTIRQWAELDIYPDIYPDGFARSPAEIGKIKACRQWVAENQYPDGTIAVAVDDAGDGLIVQRIDGRWCHAGLHAANHPVEASSIAVIVGAIHTPPTMRDHLHAIGLTDEMIVSRQIGLRDIGDSETVLAVIWKACREAERD